MGGTDTSTASRDARGFPAGPAGELLLSGVLLLYTAVVAPVQICLWNYDDPCNAFPTLYFDVFIDAFFLVRTFTARAHAHTRLHKRARTCRTNACERTRARSQARARADGGV